MKNRNLLTTFIVLFFFLFVLSFKANSQNIGINSTGATPNSSAMLDIDVSAMASKKGLLIPRITAAQKTAMNPLPAAAQGLLIYQTDGVQGFYYNTSTTTTPNWNYINPSSGGWATSGNSGTTAGTNFLGTTDAQSLDFRTNDILRARITTKGQIETFNTLFSVWIGDGAGSNITTGSNNTFVGYHAGIVNTTGYNNTAIGCLSLQKCISGTYNTGVGMYSLYNLTTGSYNVAIGDAAGSATNGTGNIFLGTAAGDNMLSGNNNIIIGDHIDAQNSTANNQLNIGNIIFGNGLDGTMTTVSSGNIGIGKNNPQYRFEILKNTTTSHDRALNIEFNSNAATTTAPLHSDSSAALFIRTRGTSTGDVYSGYFNTTSNSTGYSAGLINYVSGTGTGSKIGVAEMIFGNGDKAGFSANISGTGTSHYGAYYDVSGASTNYGLYAKVDGVNDYGVFIEGNPRYSAYLSGGVCYVKDIVSVGYNGGAFNNTYTLDINGKSNFTNALFFNGVAGTSGNILQSNGSTNPPSWVSLAAIGMFWEQDANGDIFNNNSWGKVDVTSPNTKNTTDVFLNLFRIKSNDLVNPLAIQMGIKTDISSANRYGAIEVDDGGTAKNLILQPNSGNVGIGTVSPATTLHVVGNTRITSLSGSGNRMVRTDANGTLTAYAAGTASQVLLGTGVWGSVPGGGNNWSVSGNAGINPATNYIGTSDLNDLVFKTNSTEWIRILSGGNVGIGTTTPTEKLDVAGKTKTQQFQLTTGATNGYVLTSDGSGNATWQASPTVTSWNLNGNSGTSALTNYIGTSDANDLVIKTNATEWVRVLSNGKVGIGTSTPTEKFQVTQTSEANKNAIYCFANQTSNGSDYQNTAITGFGQGNGISGASGWGYGFGIKGIGSVNSYGAVGVFAGLGTSVPLLTPSNLYYALYADASSTSGITKYAGVFMNGNVGIGTTTPSYQLQLSTDNAAKPSTNTWTIASDERLKKDITSFTDGLNVILQINPVKYKYNGKAGMPIDQENIGILAQEIQKVAPYTVGIFKYTESNSTDRNIPKNETEYLSFNSHALTFVTINAIKEQQKQIDELQKTVENQQRLIEQLLNK